MRNLCFFAFFLCSLVFNIPKISYAQDQKKSENKNQFFNDNKIIEMEELSETTDMHVRLAYLTGTWNYKVTLWATPDAKPDVSEGSTVNQMIYGERFLKTEAEALMNLGGHYLSYEGQGLIGYDKDREVYTSVWIDTMSTGMRTATGTYNEETDTIELTGNYMSPVNQKNSSFRAELQLTSADSYKYVQYAPSKSGKEFKTMEIEYRR